MLKAVAVAACFVCAPFAAMAASDAFDTDGRILLENSNWAFVKTADVAETTTPAEVDAAKASCAARTNAIVFSGSATSEQILTIKDGAPVGHREFAAMIRHEGEAGTGPEYGFYATPDDVQAALTASYDSEARTLTVIELGSDTATFYAQCD